MLAAMERAIEDGFRRWRAHRDPGALAEVFDATAPRLLRLAVHLVGDAAAAEDLVQKTFVTAIEEAATFDARRPLEPWLAGILTNHARALRREARREPDLARLVERGQRTPLEEASSRELAGEVARALDALPEPYRETLLLRVRHGMKAADIAHLVGVSPVAVRVRIHRGLEMLRKRLPAGVALGALLALEPARGLAALREAVLAHASRAAAAAPSAGLAAKVGGTLVAKKVGLALVVVALGLWWWSRSSQGGARSLEPASAREAVAAPRGAPRERVLAGTSAEAPPPEPRLAAAAPSELPAVIRGRVLDGETGAPISGARLALHAPRATTLSELMRRWPDRVVQGWKGEPRASGSPWPAILEPLGEDARLDRAAFDVLEPPPDGAEPLARATSDADGAYALTAPERWGFLVVEAAGYAARGLPALRRHTLHLFGAGGESVEREVELDGLDVQLFRPWTLTGHLIDEKGERLARSLRIDFAGRAPAHATEGTARRLAAIDAELGFPAEFSLGTEAIDRWSTRTEADGTFAVEVAAREVEVCGAEEGWVAPGQGLHPVHKKPWVFVSSWSRDATEPAVVVLREARELPVLVVRDAASGAPVEDVGLIVRDADGYPSWCGLFHARAGRLPLVEPDVLRNPYVLEQHAQRHRLTVWSHRHRASSVEVDDLSRGGRIEVALEAGPVPTLTGAVSRSGDPVANARVSLLAFSRMQWREVENGVVATARTDASGGFTLSAPGGEYLVRCTAGGRTLIRVVTLPGLAPLRIDLDVASSVVVQVRSSAGPPATAHRVVLVGAQGGQRSVETDERGAARFGDLAEGRYTLHVPHRSARGSFQPDQSLEVELAPGESRTVDVVIPASDPRYARLVTHPATDLAGWRARDRLFDDDAWVSVEPDGRVPIDVQLGVRELEVESPDGRRWTRTIPRDPPDGLALAIEIEGPGYSGVLFDARGAPRAGVWVLASSAVGDHDAAGARTDAEGRFAVRGLAARPHVLRFRGAPDPHGRRDPLELVSLELSAPAEVPPRALTIRLPSIDDETREVGEPLDVRGRVRVGGQPAAGLQVSIRALEAVADGVLLASRGASWARTDGDGAYRVLVPRAARLRASFWDPATRRRLPPVEWTCTAGDGAETRDFDL